MGARMELAWQDGVASLTLDDGRANAIGTGFLAEFAPGGAHVVMVSRTRFRALTLEEQRGGRADPEAIEALLARTVRENPFALAADGPNGRTRASPARRRRR